MAYFGFDFWVVCWLFEFCLLGFGLILYVLFGYLFWMLSVLGVPVRFWLTCLVLILLVFGVVNLWVCVILIWWVSVGYAFVI